MVKLDPHPALVVQWRRREHGWEALVAIAQSDALLLAWEPADHLVPVRDDSWDAPEVVKHKRG